MTVCGYLEPIEGLRERHFNKEIESGPEATKAILRELKKELPANMELSARASMFMRYDEKCPQYLQAVLTGVQVHNST